MVCGSMALCIMRDGSLKLLCKKEVVLVNSIVEQPLPRLSSFFDSVKSELLRTDLVRLVKGLDDSGHWERAVFLFEWLVLSSDSGALKLDHQVIEILVRTLGRESQDSVAAKLLDKIPLQDYMLDVRAYTTILHRWVLPPTLVTYNVILDVFGKMGRSWRKILGVLEEMRSKGLKFDEFTCSTVLSACAREGLLREAKDFVTELKSCGYEPGTVTYNALLQVFGKAGVVYTEALSVLKEMEENNCPADSVTYNELVA
ncbi:hypothetical protein ARALYDRAFT_893099 [Arabidopsis lyrata subsp. lyrata]|uniref:Pentatricopeptide repeat-containing protein n=1 Tax=Arabidopsis lyrata subsp. lyrata TaxID=81972 RepID=D7KTH2_ARALL|nr:hypothetical protein ARALYDRAFT_893099 [Arabidopsis lyrata subsp. lyrata]